MLVLPLTPDNADDAGYARQLDRFVLAAVQNFPDLTVTSTADIQVQFGLEKAKVITGSGGQTGLRVEFVVRWEIEAGRAPKS